MFSGAVEQGLIYAIMSLGVYISYKILDFADMTVDGSFPLGGAISATLLIKGYNPITALLVAMIGGAVAGFFTGFIHVKLKVSNLLAGIIVMTGLYSVNLRIMGLKDLSYASIKSAVTLAKSGETSVLKEFFKQWIPKSNASLFSTKHLLNGNVSTIIVILILIVLVKIIMDYLLKTKFGFALKALGDNESLIIGLGLNEENLKIKGLMIANSLVALSGGVYVQSQGFSDVGMGTGTIVIALASIIIGDALFGKLNFIKGTTVVIIGTIIYRIIIAFALKIGLNPSDLKLVTSALVVSIIVAKINKDKISHKIKKRKISQEI
ncbi:ABC transporter permease [Fusobacterium sp. PH5-44]|uniref:ABC transporter permease n=1 Tax=unclassified Fusobacterium TaxID=2648384 RepID=UPI003D1B9658